MISKTISKYNNAIINTTDPLLQAQTNASLQLRPSPYSDQDYKVCKRSEGSYELFELLREYFCF